MLLSLDHMFPPSRLLWRIILSVGVIDNLAFLWIEKDKSWLGLWDTEKAEVEYHPSIRHIAFEVSIEGLKHSVEWLKNRGYEPRKAFGFEPTELFYAEQ